MAIIANIATTWPLCTWNASKMMVLIFFFSLKQITQRNMTSCSNISIICQENCNKNPREKKNFQAWFVEMIVRAIFEDNSAQIDFRSRRCYTIIVCSIYSSNIWYLVIFGDFFFFDLFRTFFFFTFEDDNLKNFYYYKRIFNLIWWKKIFLRKEYYS